MNKKLLINTIKEVQGNLTQNEFAIACGISSSSLTRIYQGKQKPSPELLVKIADYANSMVVFNKLFSAADYIPGALQGAIDYEVFPNRLRELRLEKNISMDELSAMTKIPRQRLESFEDGTAFINDFIEIRKLSHVLDVYTDYLGGTSEIRNEESSDEYNQNADNIAQNCKLMAFEKSKEIIEQFNMASSFLVSLQADYGNKVLDIIAPIVLIFMEEMQYIMISACGYEQIEDIFDKKLNRFRAAPFCQQSEDLQLSLVNEYHCNNLNMVHRSLGIMAQQIESVFWDALNNVYPDLAEAYRKASEDDGKTEIDKESLFQMFLNMDNAQLNSD